MNTMKTKPMNKIRVGIQRNITDKSCPVESVPLLDVLEQMHTSDNLKALTHAVVNAKNKDERDRLKRELPAVIISCDTTHRKVHDDDKRTGLILMDIDAQDNEMPLQEMRELITSMRADFPYIIGLTLSASWQGLKVLCGIPKDSELHLRSFLALEKIFESYGMTVDRACKDLKRVNYLCHDPDVQETLIEPLLAWEGEAVEPLLEVKRKKYKVTRSTSTFDTFTPDDEASLCLKHLDPDMPYEEWLAIGMALKDHGCSCALWDAWSATGESYKPGECESKWAGFNGSGVGFGTVVKMATEANGGLNPVSAAKNQREIVSVSASDFDEINHDDEQADNDDDVQPLITKENAYYNNGKYFILDASGKKFIQLNGEGFTRQLRMQGMSHRGADGEMSAVDRFKAYVELHNTVDACGALAGRSIGLRDSEGTGMSYLVTRKNARTVAEAGSWDNIREILEAQYGEDQLRYLYAWLHRSRYQLEQEEFMQGHALVISGKVGGGKSLIITNVIKALLGEVGDAYQYLCKDNQFNGDLIGAEMLLIDDKPLSRRMEDRKIFGNQIKSVVAASSDVRCHRKGVDGFNVNPLWRIVIAINDTEQDLGSMPPLGEGQEDTIGDKVLMLKCFPAKLPFTGDRDQFTKVKALIRSEIQAFAHFIDNYTISEGIKQGDCRFGFDAFHHPDLLDILNQNSNERTLLSVTTSVLFNDEFRVDVLTCASTGRRYWEGTAKQWSDALLHSKDVSHRVKGTVEGELAFGDSAQKAGRKIKDVAAISGGRIIFAGHTRNGNIWRIWDDEGDQSDDENDPF